jgi:glucose-6-phosphate 1-dehydrogenase
MTQRAALEPAIIVIFGITGDLAQRKLLPALYHLCKDDLLHEKTIIIGITRRAVTVQELLDNVELCVNEIDKVCDPEGLRKVHERLRMHQMDLVAGNGYDELLQRLNALEAEQGVCMNRLYYLSIPPQVFGPIVRNLGEHGLNASCQHGVAATRLLIEKPFGYDLKSAEELITNTSEWFGEEQIFRIDHYLAKETVQNILTFRAYNPIFAGVWDASHICKIEIIATEQIGIENRAVFYEQTGALRDFIQSHLLQLLAIVTMEIPDTLTSENIHKAKLALLGKVQPVEQTAVEQLAWRGQYTSYQQEVANPASWVETYAATQVTIDNARWRGVPIVLATGKALAEKHTEVRIYFRSADEGHTNTLSFRIQPNEGIDIGVNAKRPGFAEAVQQVRMDFSYQNTFNDQGHPDAYERVLVDAVRGDHTLFATGSEVLAAWKAVQAVITAWSQDDTGLIPYEPGTQLGKLPPFRAEEP